MKTYGPLWRKRCILEHRLQLKQLWLGPFILTTTQICLSLLVWVGMKEYTQKETVIQLKMLTLAKYSKGTMITKSRCKGGNYDFFTKLKQKRNASVTKIAGNGNTMANGTREKRATK